MRSCILVSLASVVASDFSLSVPGLGDLQGKSAYRIDQSVAVFQGIPYAQAPVGDLRWRAPEPHGAWEGVRDATAFGASCMGSGVKGASEDCLFLNVAAPASALGDENAKHAVMAWIHGGTYDDEAGSQFPAENVVYYSEQPVVVATMNYRINMFGFLGSQSLAQRSSDGTGNYGLQDQRLALVWLRDHVGAFGGDGHAVTLFGESAGGNSLIHHLVQPASAGLFQRVIVESGTYAAGYGLQDAEAIYDGIRNQVGCSDLDCLLGKSAQELSDAKDVWASQASLPELHWGPVVDGVSMDDEPQKLIAAGRFQKDVGVLIGSNLDEFSAFLPKNLTGYKPQMSESEFEALIAYLGDDNARTVKQLYDPSVYEYPSSLGNFSQWWWMAMRVATDNGIPFEGFAKGVALGHCSMRRVAENLLRGGAPSVHMYNFARSLSGGQVGHGMDVPFVFAMDAYVGLQPGNKALSTSMIGYWSSFAASGTPSASDMPQWPAYDVESRTNVRLDASFTKAVISTEQSYRQPACDFWDTLAGSASASAQVLV